MNLFNNELIEEYIEWENANPDNFSWWKFVNIKSDLNTALAFAKFFCPDIIIVDDCFILKDKYSESVYKGWKNSCNNNKTDIEKMVNLYSVRDFFHINYMESENAEEKIVVLGNVLKYFWDMCFKQRFPNKIIKVKVFKEYDDELFITVYEDAKYGDHYHYIPDGKSRIPCPDTGDTHMKPGGKVPS